jgi:hypothetical protein
VGVIGGDDKRQFTGMPLISFDGKLIGKQIIFKGTTLKCLPKEKPPKDLLFSFSKSHWTQLHTLKEFILKLVRPYIDEIKK